ncbi:MAG TPA: PEP-CTERM sorting domain-containing protein [Bryobacteraceae bacterium]|jgi:hypothetical protein|nr:PEP-CTERM sorting domain-containing protein [Bryobacteraceae bacterium]
MRLSIAVSLLALVGAIPARSSAVYYTIDFTATYGGTTVPDSGSFYYDSAVPAFTDFWVVWQGTTFDLTSLADAPTILGAPPCIGGNTGAAATFLVMTACPTASWNYVTESFGPGAFEFIDYQGDGSAGNNFYIATDPNCSNNCVANQGGTFVSAAPEPGTTALMLIGFGWLLRKRIAQGVCRVL